MYQLRNWCNDDTIKVGYCCRVLGCFKDQHSFCNDVACCPEAIVLDRYLEYTRQPVGFYILTMLIFQSTHVFRSHLLIIYYYDYGLQIYMIVVSITSDLWSWIHILLISSKLGIRYHWTWCVSNADSSFNMIKLYKFYYKI